MALSCLRTALTASFKSFATWRRSKQILASASSTGSRVERTYAAHMSICGPDVATSSRGAADGTPRGSAQAFRFTIASTHTGT